MKIVPLSQEKRNVLVLVLAQALPGAQMPMIIIVGGLAGQLLAPNPCFATLPISLMVFGSMTTAPWLSNLMQHFDRRLGFIVGTIGGSLGGLTCAYALVASSFPLFLLGSYFSGVYMSANGFYRFAAADTASPEFRPKAIAYVLAGGLAAAIFGPQLVKFTAEAAIVPFVATYIGVLVLNIVGAMLFVFLDIPKPEQEKDGKTATKRSYKELLATPRIVVSIVCAMVSYALMNLVMTSTPLAMVACGFSSSNAADVVSSHVIAMFGPSFFTGHLIARFGADRIVAIGLTLLAFAGVVGLAGIELWNFFGTLVLLGIGWNFGFIGATAMLVEAHAPNERGRVQGLNDLCVFGCVTLASLASGTLMNCTGGSAQQGWSMVNIAMVPFLLLAGGMLLWLFRRESRQV